MRRVVGLYLLLFPAALAGSAGLSFLLFRHVDLRFEAFAAVVAVPAFQALVVAALSRRPGSTPLAALAARALSDRAVAPLLAADALLLALFVLRASDPAWGLADGPVPAAWGAAKGLAAAGLLLLLAALRPGKAAGRLCLAVTGIGLAAYALDTFRPWLFRLPERVLPGRSLLYRWLASYGALWVVAVAGLLLAAALLWRRREEAGFLADLAAGATLLSGLLVVLNVFLHPFLVEPWQSLVKALGSLTMTLLLASALLALRARPAR